MSNTNLTQVEHAGHRIGEYLHYQREKRQYSLSEFATKTDLTPSFIFRLENKEYKTVKFDVIQKIASGLNMSVRSLLWKCGLIEGEEPWQLPSFEYYLKEKFQLPPSAIEDVKLFLAFVHKKYRIEVDAMKKAHRKYWKKDKRSSG